MNEPQVDPYLVTQYSRNTLALENPVNRSFSGYQAFFENDESDEETMPTTWTERRQRALLRHAR